MGADVIRRTKRCLGVCFALVAWDRRPPSNAPADLVDVIESLSDYPVLF
jgi:hypothetical protein